MKPKRTRTKSALTARGSTRHWRKIRQEVLDRDDHVCHWCGKHATQADHLIARAEGGLDDADNLVASCGPCNAKRGVITRENIAIFSGRRTPTHPSEAKISPIITETYSDVWQPNQS